ncbi:MAG: M16 family metallopeptidase [Vulcanimicrobiaceae bacterium]
MNKPLVLAIALVACALAGGRAPAADPAVPAPSVTSYGKATLVEQSNPQSSLVGTELFIQAGLDRQTPRQNGLAALVAEAILGTNVRNADGKTMALRDAIAANGGSVGYNVDGHDVRFYLEGLKGSYGTTLLPLFQTALAKPDFTASALELARARLEKKISENERIALTVGIEMLNGTFYQNSSAGLPEFGIPATLINQGPSDAQAFYATHYRRDRAIVSAVGDLSTLPPDSYRKLLGVLPTGSSQAVVIKTPALPGSSRQLVTHRDISAPWLVAQYPAPALDSNDFGPMLVLTAFIQRTLADISELPTVATKSFVDQGVGALYNFDAQPANVIVYVDGGLGDPTKTFATALTVVNVLGAAKLQGNIDDMKAMAAGQFVNTATTLEDRAWLAGVFATQSTSPDYLNRAVGAIGKTSIADLQRVARKYLGSPTVALVLPRTAQAQQQNN